MRSCKKYLLLLGLLLMAAVGGCGGIGYEETDENKPVTIKGPEGLPTNPKILIAYFSHTGNTELAAWQIQAAEIFLTHSGYLCTISNRNMVF